MGNRFSENWEEHFGDVEGEKKVDRVGDEYKDYIWEQMIKKKRPDLLPEDEEYQVLRDRDYKAWEKEGEMINYSDAMKWIEGMNKIPVTDWDKDLEWMGTEKGSRIFSCLGAKLLEMSCDKLGINYEALTIERKLAATSVIRDYTSIIAWIARNKNKVEQEKPNEIE
jgi:hypothetical protein